MEKTSNNLIILQKPYITEYEDCMGVISTRNLLIGEKLEDGRIKIILTPYIEPLSFNGPGTYKVKVFKDKNSHDFITFNIIIKNDIKDYHLLEDPEHFKIKE